MQSSNQRDTRRQAFRDLLHFHAVEWAWQRASDLLELGRPPVQRLDMPIVGRVVKYLQERAGISMNWPGKPKEGVSDIAAAHAVRERGGLYEDVLQAFLLTPLSFAEIGIRVGMPTAAVEGYHQVFFDVRDRLTADGWITARAIGYKRLIQDPSTIGMVLRKFGYFAGEYIVDKLLVYLLRHQSGQLQLPAPPVNLAECEEQAIRRVLALELLPLDERSVMLMFHLHADLLLKQATHGTVPVGDVGGDWLDYISFTGQGSELKSVLNPRWSPLKKEVA